MTCVGGEKSFRAPDSLRFFYVILIFLFHFVVGFRYRARDGLAIRLRSAGGKAKLDYFLTFKRRSIQRDCRNFYCVCERKLERQPRAQTAMIFLLPRGETMKLGSRKIYVYMFQIHRISS